MVYVNCMEAVLIVDRIFDIFSWCGGGWFGIPHRTLPPPAFNLQVTFLKECARKCARKCAENRPVRECIKFKNGKLREIQKLC